MGLEQVNQQAAMLSSLSAAEGLTQTLRNELERETDTQNSSKVQESAIKKALDGKGAKAGTQILAQLAAKMAKQINPAKLMKNLADEYSFINGQAESSEDMVSINEAIARMSRSRNQNKQNQQNLGGKGEDVSAESKASDVKEYIGAYSSMLVNGGQEAKKKMDQLENRLLKENGVSLKDLKGLKHQVANSVRSEVAQQIKESYLKQVLTKSKSLDMLIAKKETEGVLTFAHKKANLGGYDFGGYKGSLQGTMNDSRAEVHQMLRDFVDEALTGEFVKKSMGKGKGGDSEKAIQELLELGSKIGYDPLSFVNKLSRIKEDQGLNGIINFENPGAGAGANNSDQRRDQHQYQYTLAEEQEVLTDKLRALYMRRAVYGDTRTVLTTQFKMIKTKNGLIKLGVKNFNQVEIEGRACAKIKLFEMLREAFEERATYAKLSGESWKMTERKIKTVLRNLEKLGVLLTKIELDQVRDKANEKMYREAEHELNLINTAIEARGEMKYLTSKRKTVAAMLERVAEESNFQAPGHEIELSVREAC